MCWGHSTTTSTVISHISHSTPGAAGAVVLWTRYQPAPSIGVNIYCIYFSQKIEILYFICLYFASICNPTVKKLKLVFKNAAKVIDPVVILFSADKEISGTQSLCVCWLVLPWISLYLPLPVAPAPPGPDCLTVLVLAPVLCVVTLVSL